MEGKVSGSTDGGHRGLNGHELNSDFVFSNTKKIINSVTDSPSLETFKTQRDMALAT